MAETIHQRIERERKTSAPDGFSWTQIREFRKYARGYQRKTLNADQIRIMQAVVKNDFADNVLKKIIQEHSSRLRIARFDVDDEQVSAYLFEVYVKNQLSDLFAEACYAALRDGNHALSLNWHPTDDPDNPYGGYTTIARERWWDGKTGTFIMYGDNSKPIYAVKEWLPLGVAPRRRRTVYYPDYFVRYEFDGSWKVINTEDDIEVIREAGRVDEATGLALEGGVPWTHADGRAIGIPVIHLANGSDDDGFYGASILDGGVLAIQDQINAIQHDITAASMFNGSPQTFSKGFALPKDSNNRPERVVTGPGMHHHSDEEGAAWGTIPPGDLSQLAAAYRLKHEALARNTHTPLHSITGQWPSGEALYREELPLINDSKKLAESLGPAMSSVMHVSTEIQNAFGLAVLDTKALIRTIFEPPEQRDPLTNWAVAEKAAAHVSKREVLRIAGYEPKRIEEIVSEMEAEAAEALAAAQAAFTRPADLGGLQEANGDTVKTDNGDANEDENA